MAKIQQALKWTLYALAFVGFYGTWIRSALNGTLAILFGSLHVTGTLPDSQIPLKTSITGIYWPLDYLLDMLIVFFWQVVDGSHPSTSLYGIYFAGQHLATIVILYVDSYKSNSIKNWKSSPTLWLYIFQATAVATSGPWFILYTLAAAEASPSFSSSKDNVRAINFVPLTIFVGYILLVIGQSLPSTGPRALVSPSTQQVLVAIWNVFPMFTGLLQWIFQATFSSSADSTSSSKPSSRNNTALLSALRRAYAFAIFCSFATHAAFVATVVSTILFPTMFSASAIQAFHPGRMFGLPFSHAEVKSMGVGALQFLQWDLAIGFATFLVPAVVKYYGSAAGSKESSASLTFKVLAAVMLAGPGAALIGLKWLDDEVTLDEQNKVASASKKV